jgi:hypothetical protein
MNPDIRAEMARLDYVLYKFREDIRKEAANDFANTASVIRSMHPASETEQPKGRSRINWNLVTALGAGVLFSGVSKYFLNNGINIG